MYVGGCMVHGRANFLQGIYGWHGEGFPVPAAKIYIGGCLGVCLRGYGGHWLGITSGGVAAKELVNGASHIYIILRFSAMLPVLSQSIVSVPQSVVAMNVVECVRAMVIRVVICMIVAGACKGFKLGPSSIFSFALLCRN